MVATFADPNNAAYLVSETVQENVDDIMVEAEIALKNRALPLANQSSDIFLQTIPRLSAAGEEQIDLAIDVMIPQISRELEDLLVGYIHENSGNLKLLAEHSDKEALARAFVASLMDEWGRLFNERIEAETEGQLNAKYFLQNTLYGLQTVNAHLEAITSKDLEDLNRQEMLQVQIVAALLRRITEQATE